MLEFHHLDIEADFNIEYASTCPYDYLSVHDVINGSPSLELTYCATKEYSEFLFSIKSHVSFTFKAHHGLAKTISTRRK